MRIWIDFCNKKLRKIMQSIVELITWILPWKWFDFEEWRKWDELGKFLEITGIVKCW